MLTILGLSPDIHFTLYQNKVRYDLLIQREAGRLEQILTERGLCKLLDTFGNTSAINNFKRCTLK